MKPIQFSQANAVLHKPPSMTEDECGSLPVFASPINFSKVISCWKPTWRERLDLLLGRPLWVWVMTRPPAHPPIALSTENPFPSSPE